LQQNDLPAAEPRIDVRDEDESDTDGDETEDHDGVSEQVSLRSFCADHIAVN
jgi:hypothetical protein